MDPRTIIEVSKGTSLAVAELDCELAGCVVPGMEAMVAAFELLTPALPRVDAAPELLTAVVADDLALESELDPVHSLMRLRHWNCRTGRICRTSSAFGSSRMICLKRCSHCCYRYGCRFHLTENDQNSMYASSHETTSKEDGNRS